jgi:hypothetical protein
VLKPYFSEEQIAQLTADAATIGDKTDRLPLKYAYFRFKNDQARHYATQGFGRRIQVLRRCVENVFKIIPLWTVDVPSKRQLCDAQINIQAFLANVYGSIDNLAWIWVFERDLAGTIPRGHVGLGKDNKRVRASFSVELQAYLKSLDEWFDYLSEFRHALAHRIPVYIPPGMVLPKDADAYNDLTMKMTSAQLDPDEYERLSQEQNKLLVFQPLVAQSTLETKNPYFFHPQMLNDFVTVEALADKMLKELVARVP